MSDQIQINKGTLSLIKGDITDLDIDCFVYYAQSDLKLGSGFGGAISVRGGMSIQKELDQKSPISAGQAIISDAGELKAKYIIHANGPKFQEDNVEEKLKITIENSLKLADDKGVKSIALPPMGTGFYGVPLKTSARITIDTIIEYLKGDTGIEKVIIGVVDDREYRPFHERLTAFHHTGDNG